MATRPAIDIPIVVTFVSWRIRCSGGPPGVGLLLVRTGTRWRSPFPDDERGRGRVPGFENLPAVLATAAVLQARREEIDEERSVQDFVVVNDDRVPLHTIINFYSGLTALEHREGPRLQVEVRRITVARSTWVMPGSSILT